MKLTRRQVPPHPESRRATYRTPSPYRMVGVCTRRRQERAPVRAPAPSGPQGRLCGHLSRGPRLVAGQATLLTRLLRLEAPTV